MLEEQGKKSEAMLTKFRASQRGLGAARAAAMTRSTILDLFLSLGGLPPLCAYPRYAHINLVQHDAWT